MQNDYSAPVNCMTSIDKEIVYATGQYLFYKNRKLKSDCNIHKFRIIDEFICAFGKYSLIIIDTKKNINFYIKINAWIGDVTFFVDTFHLISLRGEIYKFNLKNIISSLDKNPCINYVKACKVSSNIKFTATTITYDNANILSGSWNGVIRCNDMDFKIHEGTIYDIDVNETHIISCSTDRSVCVVDKKFNILIRMYDYRNRIFKCGFVSDVKFIEKILIYNKQLLHIKKNRKNTEINITSSDKRNENKNDLLYNIVKECDEKLISNKKEDIIENDSIYNTITMCGEKPIVKKNEDTIKNDVFYYTITECGKLRIYKNDNIIYEYISKDESLQCIMIQQGELLCGYKNGSINIKHIENIEYISNVNNFCLNEDEYILYYKNSINNYLCPFKINCMHTIRGTLYMSHKNALYKFLQGEFVHVKTFSESIIRIYDFGILFSNSFTTFNNCFDQYKKIYNIKNVTSYNYNCIGTKNGILFFNDQLIKISKDAITGIFEQKNFIYLSCRDGYIYLVDKVELNNLIKNIENKLAYNNITLRKKFIANEFLEGLFMKNEKIYCYYFSKNMLFISSFTTQKTFKLTFKPKRYQIDHKKFSFIKEDRLYEIKLSDGDFIGCGRYNNAISTDNYIFASSDFHIDYYIDFIHCDRIAISNVSSMKYNNNYIYVSTLNGSFYVIEIYYLHLVENTRINLTERILNVEIIYQNKNMSNLVLLLGNGNIVLLKAIHGPNSTIEIISLIKNDILYTCSYFYKKNSYLYLGRADGFIDILEVTKEKLNEPGNIITGNKMNVHKILYIENQNILICVGDDHLIKFYKDEILYRKLNLHIGTIRDCLVIDNEYIATLSIDRYFVVYDFIGDNIVLRKKISIYNPKSIVYCNNSFLIFGCGYEKIKKTF